MNAVADDLFQIRYGRTLDASSVFRLIDNQSVSAETGIRLIEGYGIRKAREAVERMREYSGLEYDREIEERVARMNEALDQFLLSAAEKNAEALDED